MPGKLSLGTANLPNDTNGSPMVNPNFQDSRAYEDGVAYRMGGTALQRPQANNPHNATGDVAAANAWDAGWLDAHGDGLGANGTIAESSCFRGQTAPA